MKMLKSTDTHTKTVSPSYILSPKHLPRQLPLINQSISSRMCVKDTLSFWVTEAKEQLQIISSVKAVILFYLFTLVYTAQQSCQLLDFNKICWLGYYIARYHGK